MTLRRDSGFGGRGDDVYAALIAAHAGLTDGESLALNARLVLILANEVGDLSVIAAAAAAARASVERERPGQEQSA